MRPRVRDLQDDEEIVEVEEELGLLERCEIRRYIFHLGERFRVRRRRGRCRRRAAEHLS